MPTNATARQRLDQRLDTVKSLRELPRPPKGWIRAIRDALGMSSNELAQRLDVAQQTVVDWERSEERNTIKLETLQRAADALDCDLVYALVPRAGLEESVRIQARRRAVIHLASVGHHARLEDQAVTGPDLETQIDELTTFFASRRGLWSRPPA
jgi:predicted DNA-binding mobile mystery protein A